MKAVILAAGEGKRLRPFTETMPKVMLPVANKPILEHVLDSVRKSGIDEVIVVVGYKKEVIMEYFERYNDLKITYVTQVKQLGTAHALLQAKEHIKEPFLVLSGDNIVDEHSISSLIKDPSDYAMLIRENPQPSKYGVVFIENNILKKIVKQPLEKKGGLISTGIYIFPPTIFENVAAFVAQGNYSLFSVIQSIVDSGAQITTLLTDAWMDIVYPWDIIRINEFMIKNKAFSKNGKIEPGVVIKGQVSVGKNTRIHAGCYIVGPVVIGENCEIGPYACISPSTSIGNDSVIRPFSDIRNCVIMSDVHIGSHAGITNSIIGKATTIGNNFIGISGETTVQIDGNFIPLNNLGAMIGEDSTIGHSVIVEPGRLIGRKCDIESFNRIKVNIPSQSKVM
jgi:UDP-N-acetylglucosamine diphosphorylase/glucosamine-1-phosphate N-acetyltransferase